MTPKQIKKLAKDFDIEIEVVGKVSSPDQVWVWGPDNVYGMDIEHEMPGCRQDPFEGYHCQADWSEAEDAVLSYIIDIFLYQKINIEEYWSDILLAQVGWPRLEPIVLHHDPTCAAMLYDWAQDAHPDWPDLILLCRKIHLSLDA